MKTDKLTCSALNWAVAKCENNEKVSRGRLGSAYCLDEWGRHIEFRPSTDWNIGGPIIERAGINVMLRYGSLPPNHVHDTWDALIKPEFYSSGRPGTGVKKEVMMTGPTPLIAAMRCYVASRLGDNVDVPKELT